MKSRAGRTQTRKLVAGNGHGMNEAIRIVLVSQLAVARCMGAGQGDLQCGKTQFVHPGRDIGELFNTGAYQ